MIRVYKVRRREAARMAQLLGVWEASVRAPAVPVGAGDPAPPELCAAGLGGCGHLLIAEREGQPVEFMGVEEVTVNEQDPHAVGFTGIWDLKFISGAIATRRAAPIRCCICGGKTTGAENSA